MSHESNASYQVADEVATVENPYEIPQTGADASESHQHFYTGVLSQDRNVMEMTPANSNNSDRVEGKATQDQDYGKLFAEIRQSRKKVFSCLVVLLILVLVFGITSVTLMSLLPLQEDKKVQTPTVLFENKSMEREISNITSPKAANTQQSSTNLTSTKATYTQKSSTSLTSTEATYTQKSSTSLTSTEATYTQRSFTYFTSTENLGSYCYTAFYRADGNILVGTHNGVKLVNRRNMAVTSYNTGFWEVTAIFEWNNFIYLLHKEGDVGKADGIREITGVGKVELCPPDMTGCRTLLEFNVTSSYVAKMAISSRYIVVRNPDGNKLIIYDFISKQTKVRQSIFLYQPYFLPDGRLLFVSGSTLSKYKLEDGELELLWACGGLTNLMDMVADTDGFIYGLTRAQKSVYIISPDGKLLQTIQNDKLPIPYPGQARISGDEIAVPGWHDRKLHLFRINK